MENSLPNFLCIGAQKSGTTTLYDILKQHPHIFLPDKKELHFFDIESKYQKGVKYYSSYFQGSNSYLSVGEITPIYIYLKECP